MKPFNQICNLSSEAFKRATGLSKENVELLIEEAENYINAEKELFPEKKRGRKDSKIVLADRVLLTLYYLRHYPTFENLGDVFGISESYCCKIYHEYARILAQVARLPNRKEMIDNPVETLIIDVSEQPIERPVKKQGDYYSGKKKGHTIKAQLVICAVNLVILSVVLGKGRRHDFSIFKESRLFLHPDSTLLADSGYQGIAKYHKNSSIPIKKKKGQPLTAEDKEHNKKLSKQRIFIENVNRRCKIFRIVKDVYRGKHKNYSLTWNLVAALVNIRHSSI